MIIYPKDWQMVGRDIGVKEIEYQLIKVMSDINCNCLSFSGGLDSSLLLYYMCQYYNIHSLKSIKVFTTGESATHPDIMYALRTVEYFRNKFKHIDLKHYVLYLRDREARDKLEAMVKEEFIGDNVVRLFYGWLSKYTDKIIAGDGVDEFMCGYYGHFNISEYIYYDYLRLLQKNHLVPLNKNSGKVKVYLPYIDTRLIALFSQIPLEEKINGGIRKKMIVELAKGKVPDEIIKRRKYGFCDTLMIK